MSATAHARRHEHSTFLNEYYGISRHFYDLTRKYYLFGRDAVLDTLGTESFASLLEIGPGTGRNLQILHKKRPNLKLGGIEASRAMLEVAELRCPFASFHEGFAEDAPIESVLGRAPDRILFSYCLSMVQEPVIALDAAIRGLAPGGSVVIVDFGDFSKLPGWFAQFMNKWLEMFHVHPVPVSMLLERRAKITWGPGRYYFIARLSQSDA
jgi:S-adenosylmethionine-diacylgycerolhomoserine-N-methlytransferase